MPHPKGTVNRRQIITYAKKRGVSEAQFDRWRKNGLLPSPELVSLGRGKGREARYLVETKDQLDALLSVRQIDKRISNIAWLLWCEGYPVTPPVKKNLLSLLRKYETQSRKILDYFENEKPGNLIDRSAEMRLPPGVGNLRRRVGKRGLSTLLRMWAEANIGKFGERTRYDRADLQFFTRAFDPKSGSGEEGELILNYASEWLNLPRIINCLERCDNQRLEQLRDEAQTILRIGLSWAGDQVRRPLPPFLFLIWFYIREVNPSANAFVHDLIHDPPASGLSDVQRDLIGALSKQQTNNTEPTKATNDA